MKIRNGFVSNSSSASYIVKIKDISLEDFCERLYREYQWFEFSMESVEKDIQKRIKTMAETIEEDEKEIKEKPDDTEFLQRFLPNYKNQLKELKELLERTKAIKKDDAVNIVKFILEYKQIKYMPATDGMVLDYFTTMHNSYDEGMSSLFQEILMYFMFESDYQVICTRDDEW